MTNNFTREARYVVLKSADVMKCLTVSELIELRCIQAKVEAHRAESGKQPLDCVVVEKDWPEYESTWRAIEARTTGAQPAANFADAYQGAMEEVAIWKKRALEAEDLNRKFVAEINGPTYMGEPAHSKPDCGEAGHDEGRCGNRQCLPGAQPAPSVPDGFAWPECPKRRQSHVLFDDGYEEGWAACVATIKAALAAPEPKP